MLLVATLLLASCGENHDVSPADSPVGKQGEMALPVDDAHWTYYSLEQGKIVGTSLFGDGNEDARWKRKRRLCAISRAYSGILQSASER